MPFGVSDWTRTSQRLDPECVSRADRHRRRNRPWRDRWRDRRVRLPTSEHRRGCERLFRSVDAGESRLWHGLTAHSLVEITPVITADPDGPAGDVVASPSLDQAREFIRLSKAENTLRGYRADWAEFCEWCKGHAVCPLPALPETVAAYIAECANRLKVGSIQRRLNAIAEAHKAMALDSPTSAGMVRNTLKGIKRTMGTAAAQKAPTLIDDVRAMVEWTQPTMG
jgi:hypothetical protein